MPKVYIGIGSNLGDRHAHLALARSALASLPNTQLLAFSPIYETEPVGPIPQPKFLNAAALIQTTLDPFDLLDALDAIQLRAGREHRSLRQKWTPRTLDLDILFYDNRVISHDELVVPHPLLHERWFVLKPLADLSPNLVHPILEMTIAQLLQYLPSPQSQPSTPIPHP